MVGDAIGVYNLGCVDIKEIRGAVARGWCHDDNRYKEMDGYLAEAISREVYKLLTGEEFNG